MCFLLICRFFSTKTFRCGEMLSDALLVLSLPHMSLTALAPGASSLAGGSPLVPVLWASGSDPNALRNMGYQ